MNESKILREFFEAQHLKWRDRRHFLPRGTGGMSAPEPPAKESRGEAGGPHLRVSGARPGNGPSHPRD